MKVIIGGVLLLGLAATAGAQVSITTCGTTVPAGQIGVLQNDLACSGPGVGVVLEKGTTLMLSGHSIGGEFLWDGMTAIFGSAVTAVGNAKVLGPGQISGIAFSRIVQFWGNKFEMRDVDVVGTGTADGIGLNGNSTGSVRLTNVTVTGASAGIVGRRIRLRDVTLTANTFAGVLSSKKIQGENVVATNNGSVGISNGGTTVIDGLTVSGHSVAGVYSFRTKLSEATITGNAVDVKSGLRPALISTTCDTSENWDVAPTTWGVCATD